MRALAPKKLDSRTTRLSGLQLSPSYTIPFKRLDLCVPMSPCQTKTGRTDSKVACEAQVTWVLCLEQSLSTGYRNHTKSSKLVNILGQFRHPGLYRLLPTAHLYSSRAVGGVDYPGSPGLVLWNHQGCWGVSGLTRPPPPSPPPFLSRPLRPQIIPQILHAAFAIAIGNKTTAKEGHTKNETPNLEPYK